MFSCNVKKHLDVHGLTLDEAIIVIRKAIKTAYEHDQSVLYVNHGFNSGNKIKTWCLNCCEHENYVLKVMPGDNEGITNIYIQLKTF